MCDAIVELFVSLRVIISKQFGSSTIDDTLLHGFEIRIVAANGCIPIEYWRAVRRVFFNKSKE